MLATQSLAPPLKKQQVVAREEAAQALGPLAGRAATGSESANAAGSASGTGTIWALSTGAAGGVTVIDVTSETAAIMIGGMAVAVMAVVVSTAATATAAMTAVTAGTAATVTAVMTAVTAENAATAIAVMIAVTVEIAATVTAVKVTGATGRANSLEPSAAPAVNLARARLTFA